MVKLTVLTVIATAMAVTPASAFVAPQTNKKSCSALAMSNSPNEQLPPMNKMTVTAALAGACLLSTVFTADIANAVENTQLDFGPSSTIIAGRGGGGRGGGRAMGGGGRSMGRGGGSYGGGASYARPVVSRTTYISRPSVVVSPFGYGGFGYSPFGGMGLGYGLGAASSIGNEIRDNRQESEIQNERVELELAKQKAAQLEQRLAMLEQAQGAPQAPVQMAPAAAQ